MIYHLSYSDNYFCYLILRGKQKKTNSRIQQFLTIFQTVGLKTTWTHRTLANWCTLGGCLCRHTRSTVRPVVVSAPRSPFAASEQPLATSPLQKKLKKQFKKQWKLTWQYYKAVFIVSVQNSPIQNSPIQNSRKSMKMNEKTVQYKTVRKTVPSPNCFNKSAGRELSFVQ